MYVFHSLRALVWGLTAALFCAAYDGLAQSAAAALPNRLPLLGGRAYLNFPASAVSSARPVDIMSAKPDEQLETRIVLDFDKSRVVFFARELFRLADSHFTEEAARFESGPFTSMPRVIRTTDSVTAVVSLAAHPDTSESAILLQRLLVRTLDNTVFEVDAYVNPAGFQRRTEFDALATAVFNTIQPGRRLLNLQARTETHDELVFQLPNNYYVSRRHSYDFYVYNIWPLTPLLSTTENRILVYLGNHPSPRYRDERLTPTDAMLTDGRFLGKTIRWMNFSHPQQQLYWREQLVPDALSKQRLGAHVIISSNSPDQLSGLTRVAEAITRKK
ncbi:hypothetical protein [Hymenobacter metallilatus]|uniref:Uncharacterized protein n=1 Tax=Hymenobacter metallilatus TaxID=2493666 RepID=A0A428JCM0_9BACT|nr:hypothetical protein [Hymenobacter metallilatus]RSK29591.1 hypothetical protein EI290_17130 [Hymenobacter metallilatus]